MQYLTNANNLHYINRYILIFYCKKKAGSSFGDFAKTKHKVNKNIISACFDSFEL
jgi:hypothetical protein